MADVKIAYASAASLTHTLASLASSATAARESTVVNNASNLYLDALVEVCVETSTGTIANDRGVHVLVYASVDGGTNYSSRCTGSDAAYTLDDPTALRYAIYIPTPAVSTVYRCAPFSVAELFGGVLPQRWGLVVLNYSGVSLTASTSNNYSKYQGVTQTVA